MPTTMTKDEFLEWLVRNYRIWAGNDQRTPQGWLYSMETFCNVLDIQITENHKPK